MFRKLPFVKSHPSVSVIRLHGVIAAGGRIGGQTLNDANLAPLIERAFTRGKPSAVALSVNSPGGSPVQSALIGARIRRLADEKNIPVFAFCEDVAASGGYWLACAADEIYADEFIARHGIERRVYTAGEDKSMLDPFRPEREEDIERLKSIQAVIHQNFIDHVTTRRGAKLLRDDIFTGEIWAGQAAQDIGLIDGIAHLVPKMKALYGDKVALNVMTQKRSLMQRFGAPGVATAVDQAISAVEDRGHWARYGQ